LTEPETRLSGGPSAAPTGGEPSEARPRRGGRNSALAVLCALLFLTFLDNTIVSVTLGNVQPDLHAGVSSLQWVVNGYALVFASLMLAAGMIGDEFGRKKVMVAGAAVFCAGSVVCALAPNVDTLIGGRVIMGLGAAGSEPGTLSMIRHLYADRRERARALGVWAAISGLALALGPVIGGALVGAGSWRWVFWFNLIFGVLVLGAVMYVLPENADPQARRVDTAGALLAAGALVAAVYGVIAGESDGYTSALVLSLFVVALVLGVCFIWWERRAANPLLDLRFLRIPAFATANVVAFAAYFGTFAIFFFTALYLQVVLGDSGYQIALQFLPMTVCMIVASVLSGRWVGAVGAGIPMATGCVLFAAGLFLTDAYLGTRPDYGPLAIALAVAGLGIGITVVPMTSAPLSAVPAERSGMAASATNTSREVGGVIGVAVLGTVVNSQLTGYLVTELRKIGVPGNFFGLVIHALETGQVPTGRAASAYVGIELRVIHAAYRAFQVALHDALVVSAGLALAAGLATALTMRGRRGSPLSS
jgi:EmrB/QacA subfamily drug resistance transporter